MKVTKKAILKELVFDKTWNQIHHCFGFSVAAVCWHYKLWKVITTDDFNKIINQNDKTYIVAEFHHQKDLCNYLFNQLKKY
jgi:hypothetical protein